MIVTLSVTFDISNSQGSQSRELGIDIEK